MKRILPLFYLLALAACDDLDSRPDANALDSKIIIGAQEVLESGSRRLFLFARTEKVYPCTNYPLITQKEVVTETSFKITFSGVLKTDMCLTAPGSAFSMVEFTGLPNGEYDLELNNVDRMSNGVLKLTDTDITFLFDEKNGIDFATATTKRVPANTYWVTIGYHVSESSVLVDEFVQKFKDAGAVFNKQAPGDYFYYQIDNAGDIVAVVENSGYYFMQKLIFQYDGDEQALKDLMDIDGGNHKEALSMALETYKGEAFYNWD